MIKYRPFVSAMVAREVRRHAILRRNANQFKTEEFDQFMAKLRTKKVIDAVCDFFENEEEFDVRNLNPTLMLTWARLRKLVEEFPSVDLEKPEMLYNMAPQRRGRRARREAGPSYEEDEAFIADRDAFYEEMNEESTSEST